MNSATGALIGLVLAIILIIRKVSPFYSMLAGAVAGGLLSGFGIEGTVADMITGVKDITPAILRILAAGVLSGALIVTGAATSISNTIMDKLGAKSAYLALALPTMILTAVGVFIDVAVITVAPIGLMLGKRAGVPKPVMLLAMIGGGKCGNVISPNPNTIIAAENYGAPLPSVMGANVIAAVIGLLVTVFIILPLASRFLGKGMQDSYGEGMNEESRKGLPSFAASISGPVTAILLLALRPVAGITIDPLIALPVGGLVGILATGCARKTGECLAYGLEKMSGVAVLLVGTGAIAGIITASDIKDVVIGMLSGWSMGGVIMAPLSGILMSAAAASTTAGATIASASFARTVLAAGVSPVWGAAMTNAGATVLDHLPHGSFFHATGGSAGMSIKERLKLIPYESLTGLTLCIVSTLCAIII